MIKLILTIMLFVPGISYAKSVAVGDEVTVNRKAVLCSAILWMRDAQTFQKSRDRDSLDGYISSGKCLKSVQRVDATVTELGASMGHAEFIKVVSSGRGYWVSKSDLK